MSVSSLAPFTHSLPFKADHQSEKFWTDVSQYQLRYSGTILARIVLTLDLVPNLAERCLDDGGLDDGSGSRDRHVQFLAREMSSLLFLQKMLLVMMYSVKV